MTSRMRWVGLALMLAVAVGFVAGSNAPARGDDPEKVSGDLKGLQGKWTTENQDSSWEFDGDKMKSTVNGLDYKCKIAIGEKATPHPTIDFIILEAEGDAKGLTARGIYKLDGDNLTICVAIPGDNPRPTELKAAEDEAYLFKLKRVK